jgi:hypothetical protein
MILTIGDKYHYKESDYVEEVEIVGLDSVDEELSKGTKILPKNGDSKIEIRGINTISAEYFHTTTPLKFLVEEYEKGEADL